MATGLQINANGIRQHVIHHAGQGPDLIVVPGITSPAVTWDFVATRLAERFNVFVLDVRGRGLSQSGDLDYSLDAMSDDLIDLVRQMDQRGLITSPVQILGHSMGARTAIRAARKDPTPFDRLFLVDPPVGGPGRRDYPMGWAWYEDSIVLTQGGCTADQMRPFVPTWTEEQVALRAQWLHTCQVDAIKTAYDGFHTDDIHSDLPHISLPMRLVVAGAAPVIQEEDVAEIRTLSPTMDVRTVENAGHMIPWDDLEGFLAEIFE